jgi:hypothetical protein
MKEQITFFSEEEELVELTGLNHDQLWDAGFCLDDWDWGFVADREWKPDYDGQHYEYHLMEMMDSYCCGYRHVEYNGKHYHMLYHS